MPVLLWLMLLVSGAALAQGGMAGAPPAMCFAQCNAAPVMTANPPAVQACLIRCRAGAEFNASSRRGPQAAGRGVAVASVAPAASHGAAPASRWGAIYAAAPPAVAVGVSQGSTDRTMVHVRAENECRARGRSDCRLLTEFSSGCGAAAHATRVIGLLATSDTSTQRVSFIAAGTGASRADAERSAISVCNSRDPTATCRIVATACAAG